MLRRLATPPRIAAIAVAALLVGGVSGFAVLQITAAPTPTPVAATPTPSPTPSPTPRPTRRPTPRPTPTASPTPSPTPTPTPAPDPDASNVTILLVARDFLAARVALGEKGMNTDMLIVANIHADGSRIDLFSLPRASVGVPLDVGTYCSCQILSPRDARLH